MLPVFIPLILFGLPTVALWVGFYFTFKNYKTRQTEQTEHRVEVTAYLVEYFGWRSPQKIIFDYPLPDGQWRRVERKVLFSPTGNNIQPGTPFSVYVNPQYPLDVSLGRSNASNGFPMLLGLAASMFTLLALASVLVMATLSA